MKFRRYTSSQKQDDFSPLRQPDGFVKVFHDKIPNSILGYYSISSSYRSVCFRFFVSSYFLFAKYQFSSYLVLFPPSPSNSSYTLGIFNRNLLPNPLQSNHFSPVYLESILILVCSLHPCSVAHCGYVPTTMVYFIRPLVRSATSIKKVQTDSALEKPRIQT
ncbi:hypothetical protein AHF37_09733 [Paragonimus kellicotti]|nr:hypothetical protein AHF37_09733 [Paragonimus kellicotti]